MEDVPKSVIYLTEVEELAGEVLRDRADIVALSRRQNENREAFRAVERERGKAWLSVGTLLIKTPNEKCKDLLKRDDVQVSAEINKLRSDLKVKVNKLQDMEHQPPVPGINLKALTREEMDAMRQVWGPSSK